MDCPHCKNPICDEEALLCHFCGGSLGRKSGSAMGFLRRPPYKILLIGVVLTLIGGLVLCFFRG